MTRRPTYVVAHWGVYEAETSEGTLTLAPFADDPDPSPIGRAMVETLDDPNRISAPAIRRGWLDGDGGAGRGADSYVEVSWDEALDRAAGELTRIRARHGCEAVYAGSYGWASAGRFHHAPSQLRRFFGLFGGCTRSRDAYSYAAGEVILPHIVAPLADILMQHTAWEAITRAGSTVLAVGGIPLRNAQVNSGGVARHTQADDIRAALAAGVRFVNVSPMRDPDLLRDVEWMPIIPGGDMALLLALAHTLVAEGLHDEAFLARYCTGFDRFLPYLLGADGQPKDADWAAPLTGFAAEDIRALARDLAAGPAVISAAWSLTRQANGEQIYWMTVTLAAMLGRIGCPGEGFALGLGAVGSAGSLRRPLSLASFPGAGTGHEGFIPVARITEMLERPGTTYRYNGQTRTYPEIRAIYWAGGNPFHHHQDLNRLQRAWREVETVIVNEPHWTPLARHADIVFPATLSAERSDISGSPRDTHLIATEPVRAPYGEARDDHAIFAGLAARITAPNGNETLAEAYTGGKTPAGWQRQMYEDSRARMAQAGEEMPDYDTFLARGIHQFSPPEIPPTLLSDFRADPEAHPLSTPSGKIEIFSEVIDGWHLEGRPGHPVWQPPEEWRFAPEAARLPLHLITHQPARRLHSQLDQSSYSREGKVAGRTPVVMHPDDAAARGLEAGAVVRVFNDRGACLAGLVIDEGVRPGVATMETGAWLDLDPATPGLCRNGNPNVLTPDRGTSEIAQGPAALSCLVEIEAAPEAPEPQAYAPPRIDRR